ncbi:hypothetical protein [Deinococcus sp. SL84]|uniref:hypothetical protein n=1 Tax=Deinococcus sp. SL84 TaxID=2994663 RepID=UPI0022763A10|nr:hypothetical protein [Deinococcus sp. SL84]MCY1703657.1 hypothetical protein [Deinococcus sp. SL84]
MLKHVRYQMLDEGHPAADGVSSFLLECMLYNVDDSIFRSSLSWSDRMQNLLLHLYQDLQSGTAEQHWTEVSGWKWLFQPTYGIEANWTPEQARTFVLAAYNRIVN